MRNMAYVKTGLLCPYCSHETVFTEKKTNHRHRAKHTHKIQTLCLKCNARGPYGDTIEEAMEKTKDMKVVLKICE